VHQAKIADGGSKTQRSRVVCKPKFTKFSGNVADPTGHDYVENYSQESHVQRLDDCSETSVGCNEVMSVGKINRGRPRIA